MTNTFNFKDSCNMVSAVCGTYVKKQEVIEYFNKEFDPEKEFTPEELKQIVRELVKGRERITTTIDQHSFGKNRWILEKEYTK